MKDQQTRPPARTTVEWAFMVGDRVHANVPCAVGEERAVGIVVQLVAQIRSKSCDVERLYVVTWIGEGGMPHEDQWMAEAALQLAEGA